MYAVVGCSECSALWILEGRPETTECPRCGSTRQFSKRRKFVTTEDEDHAREVRSSMLANRSGYGDAFADLDSFSEMDAATDEAVVSDDEYLEAAGIDPDEVAAAGERADSGGSGGSVSKKERVREAVRELDQPTEDDIVAYCGEHGVGAEYARRTLEKLARSGEVSESRGVYRLL
ncbi:DUF5817 domain-containing protein [Salarchaeum sp. JOR-1]|uniref:DUF5817 domain-containing protein n=1 Tax=Salarchaeum sp. JOR-1 TaxID=2599399 RepID=UPI001198C0B8|nr:DUF5817 domain-containing protein [Salarchaeum sp. JOR-1]QDX40733.1 replication protein H [Salarchaeum sp. JOR-1]